MARLLIVHHTASPALEELLDAVLAGARTDEVTGVEVEVRPALAATVPDVLAADGFVLGTPANIGYMSGALKHFFDQIYYPCRRTEPAARTGCTCTATVTPPARCARSRRSRPASTGGPPTPR